MVIDIKLEFLPANEILLQFKKTIGMARTRTGYLIPKTEKMLEKKRLIYIYKHSNLKRKSDLFFLFPKLTEINKYKYLQCGKYRLLA